MNAVACYFSPVEIQRADAEVAFRSYAARIAAQRFFAYQDLEAKRLGYSWATSFAKDMARGAISLAPTPEDPDHDRVGAWFWKLTQVNRVAMHFQFSRIDGRSPTRRAREEFGWSRDKFNRRIKSLLADLAGALG